MAEVNDESPLARQTTLTFLQANDEEALLQNKIDEEDKALHINEMPNLEARFDSNPEERRKTSSCPPNINGDIFNPRTKAQSSNKGSDAESSI